HLRDRTRSSRTKSVVPVSATLNVPGLPQSGTGQTALLTGKNAARIIGKHFGPYPYSTLRPVLAGENIFRKLMGENRSVYYANAFPQRYFDYVESHKSRMTAIAYAWTATGYKLNGVEALREGEALSADITSDGWNKRGFAPVSVITPQTGGERLVSL